MDWKQLLLTHRGRIGRKAFWIAQLVMFVVSVLVALMILLGLGLAGDPLAEESPVGRAMDFMTRVLLLYPAFCVTAKRLHDLGRSAWWQAAPLALIVGYLAVSGLAGAAGAGREVAGLLAIPVIVGVLSLGAWIGFAPGTPDANRYGEPDSGARKVRPVAEVFS